MTRREFRCWWEFYQRWPFDDLHRFHRPAATIAAVPAGDKFSEAFNSFVEHLQPTVATPEQIEAKKKEKWMQFLYS